MILINQFCQCRFAREPRKNNDHLDISSSFSSVPSLLLHTQRYCDVLFQNIQSSKILAIETLHRNWGRGKVRRGLDSRRSNARSRSVSKREKERDSEKKRDKVTGGETWKTETYISPFSNRTLIRKIY